MSDAPSFYRLCPECHEGILQYVRESAPYTGCYYYLCSACNGTFGSDSIMCDDSTRLVSKKYVDDMVNELYLEIGKLRDILRGLLG